jgi:dynein heavy chain 2
MSGEVPLRWLSLWDGPEDPVSWMNGVCRRRLALRTLFEKVGSGGSASLLSSSIDLSELFRPRTFLEALRQLTAREMSLPLDALKLVAGTEKTALGGARGIVARLHGIFLQGATFDGRTLRETSADAPEVEVCADISVAWIPSNLPDPYAAASCARLPLYASLARERVIAELALPLPAGEDKAKLILAGAALLVSAE